MKVGKLGLALSGGGKNGAFSVGALYYLASEVGLRFSAVSGTSTGALMTGPALVDDVEVLNDVYRGGVENRDVVERRNVLFAIVRGMISGSGMAGTEPLRKLIDAYTDFDAIARAWDRGLRAVVTTTNLRTGKPVEHWSDPALGRERWTRAVLASASMPFLMDPVVIDGDVHVDGGLRETVPVSCLLADELGLDAIVVLKTFPSEIEEDAAFRGEGGWNIVDVLRRSIDVAVDEVAVRDMPARCERAGRPIIAIEPTRHLGDSLDFDPETMKAIWKEGFDRAAAVWSAFEWTGIA